MRITIFVMAMFLFCGCAGAGEDGLQKLADRAGRVMKDQSACISEMTETISDMVSLSDLAVDRVYLSHLDRIHKALEKIKND